MGADCVILRRTHTRTRAHDAVRGHALVLTDSQGHAGGCGKVHLPCKHLSLTTELLGGAASLGTGHRTPRRWRSTGRRIPPRTNRGRQLVQPGVSARCQAPPGAACASDHPSGPKDRIRCHPGRPCRRPLSGRGASLEPHVLDLRAGGFRAVWVIIPRCSQPPITLPLHGLQIRNNRAHYCPC